MSSVRTRTTDVALMGMRFHVRVGILPHERELPQPLEIDLVVRRTADGSIVLDYRTLYALVSESVKAEPLDYLETIAAQVLDRALALQGVASARVAVRKPHVGLAGPLAYAEVTLAADND